MTSVSFAQSTFRIETGTSIVSNGDPFIVLNNTELNNNSVNSDFNDGSIWTLNGSSDIIGTGITKFYGLRLNNNGYTLTGNTIITNRLDMITGDINLGIYDLEIGTSSSNPGLINWTSGTVMGPLKRWFSASTNSTQSSGIFPIGNNSTNRNVIINYTQAPSGGGYIIVEYKSGIPSMVDNYSGLPLWSSDGQLVQNYEDQGYFDITPFDYSSSLNTSQYTLSMRGNGLTTVNDRNIIRLIKSPGPSHTTWISAGNHSSVIGSSNSDFSVISTNVTGFSWFNFGSQNANPLPVELLSFSADCFDGGVKLTWVTASELNSDHFEIERSRDGVKWDLVLTTPAAGNSNQIITYEVDDKGSKLIDDILYYRLKQFDFDGVFKNYGPISINCLKSVNGHLTTYPNPSDNLFNIILNNDLLIGNSVIKITDLFGRLIYNNKINVTPGVNLFVLDLDIKPGIYYISIDNNLHSSGIVKQVVK